MKFLNTESFFSFSNFLNWFSIKIIQITVFLLPLRLFSHSLEFFYNTQNVCCSFKFFLSLCISFNQWTIFVWDGAGTVLIILCCGYQLFLWILEISGFLKSEKCFFFRYISFVFVTLLCMWYVYTFFCAFIFDCW